MNEAIEMLNKIIEMQERNFGNGINTHLELSSMCKEAKEVVKNLTLPVVSNRSELLIAFYKKVHPDNYRLRAKIINVIAKEFAKRNL